MLKLDDNVIFTATALVALKAYTASFDVHCKLLPIDRLEELQGQLNEGKLSSAQFIGQWLVGWPEGQVCDADGQPAQFGDYSMTRLLAQPGVPVALIDAFYKGYDRATEGNFAPLSAA